MQTQDIIALTLAAAALVYVGRTLMHTWKGSSGCGHTGCGKHDDRGSKLKHLPLVTIGRGDTANASTSSSPRTRPPSADI